ncbi:MAG: copper resistance protein B [Caulobacterales bacterium]|nr:copper resistance protein B [Caulobacterales bacterium]
MRTATILTALLAITATPALAQHQGHPMPMPAPKAAPTPKPKPPPKPAAKPVTAPPKPPSPSREVAPAAPAAKPAMGQPMEAPTLDPAEGGMAGMAGMEGMDHSAPEEEVGAEPAPPLPTDHAADGVFDPAAMARARAQLQKEHGGSVLSKVMVNLGEYQVRDGENGYRWEGEAWVGGDLNRLVIKSEGAGGEDRIDAAEVQALYSRAVSPYFDLQAGLRQDFQSGPKRTYATVGFEGVAPYWFETSGSLFLSNKGELLARLEGSYDLRLTQRWILQPRIEANLSGQDISELELGSGVSNIELGLRLRYEIKREFAPYIGVSFDRKFGGTADYARALGKDDQATSFVIGLRAWF